MQLVHVFEPRVPHDAFHRSIHFVAEQNIIAQVADRINELPVHLAPKNLCGLSA
jgi:hypothetical protein